MICAGGRVCSLELKREFFVFVFIFQHLFLHFLLTLPSPNGLAFVVGHDTIATVDDFIVTKCMVSFMHSVSNQML